MNTVNNSIYNRLFNSAASGSSFAGSGVGGADFSKLLAGLGGSGNSVGTGSAGSLFARLSELFPRANFSEGTVGETPADVRSYFGDEEGDNVAIESAAAEAMAGSPALASILQGVLDALSQTAGATQPITEGARVQRNVMVASLSIRFSVSQIDGQSGETLFSNEMKTAFSEFSEKLKDMAMKFFGSGEDEDADVAAVEPQDDEGGSGNPFSGYFGAGFSFSMHLSAQWGASEGMGIAQGEPGNLSVRDFADMFRGQGNFQSYMSSTLSYAMSYGGGIGSSPFTSLLNNGMDIFGMSPMGMGRQGGGFNFQYGAGRGGALSDLMSMLSAASA